MRDVLQKRCEEFIENRDEIKKAFRLENTYMFPICANIFCARQIPAREETLRRCNDLLKSYTSAFSNFRGTVRMAMVSLLAVSLTPEEKLRRMLDYYAELKKYFLASDYLVLVAVLLAEMPEIHPMAEIIARGREIYRKMNREHPLLTSSEDCVFAVMMAFSARDDEHLIADMEDCYHKLKTVFHSSNDVQAVSQVLALSSDSTLEKTARVIALYNAVRAAGGKYGRYHELPVLAALASQPVDIQTAAAEIMEIDAFLSIQRGYSGWTISKKTRLMHAAMLLSDDCAPGTAIEAAAMSSTVAMIAAQQAVMCSVITSTTVGAGSVY